MATLFDTWATLEFKLSEQQYATGELITSDTSNVPSVVDYAINMSPLLLTAAGNDNETSTDDVYNDQSAIADQFWASGLLTVQNFIAEYLAGGYNANTTIDTYLQRYPKSSIYENTNNFDIAQVCSM